MLTPEEVLQVIKTPFQFSRRPIAVPGDHRASWRVLLLISMLSKCCRGGRSSLLRLHVLNWSTRSARNTEALVGAIMGSVEPTDVLVRFDPSLNRAIDRAIGFGIVKLPSGNRVTLTPKATEIAESVETAGVLIAELGSLERIGFQLTETKVTEITRWYNA